MAGPGGAPTPGAAAWLPPAPTPPLTTGEEPPDPASLPAQDLVLRFRATASPEAFRLAGHLALAVPSVPVMRLVQRAVNRDPRPQHLAEVILSGMLTTAPGPPGSYDFRPGVRDLLLRTLPRSTRGRTRELLEHIGGLIDERAGHTAGEFRAEAATIEADGTDTGPGPGPAFATVSEETVRRLGGNAEEPVSQPGGEADGPLHVRMLGPLRVSRSSETLPLPSTEAQALLCMLLLDAERRATYDQLARGLWAQPSGRAESVRRLDELASQVNSLLGSGTVTRTSDGYTLHTVGVEFDADACEDVLAHPHQDPRTQRSRLRDALRRFYGEPLKSLPGPAARETRFRLRSLRVALRAALVELLLELGEFDAASAEYDALLREGPDADTVRRLRPRLHAHEDHRADSPFGRPAIRFESDDGLDAHPETRIILELAVHEVVTRGALTPQQYEIHVHGNGYVVETHPDAYLLPALAAALRWLPGPLADLAEPPRLRVTFQGGPEAPAPPQVTAPVLLTVPPALYDEFAQSSAASGPHRFRPLYGDAPDGPPLAWYCPLPAPRAEDEDRDLVRGPLLTRDLRQLGIPAPGRTAIVHTRPDGPLTLLNPADPYGGRPPGPTTYYEVDLTPQHAVHRISLPSSGKGEFSAAVELSWRVADPVAFVRAEATGVTERLLAHLLKTASHITRHHSVRRATGAQRAVNAQLGRWPVPGLAVTCAVTLAPDYAPPPQVRPTAPAARPPADLLADAETVLFGFDGPLTRLFTAPTARAAALDLLSLVAEHRDPEDAMAGRPPGDPDVAGRELFVHPLDVLRTFARDRLGPLLRDRLDELELRAVPNAPTTHHSVALVRTLHGTGRRVGVVTDVCEQAVRRALESYRLPLAGVHGRDDDLRRLTPDPHCLLRALRSLGTPAATGVLIGSTLAELAAAKTVGLRFIGLARNPTIEQGLIEAGCDAAVSSLTPVLEAARAL